MGKSTVTGPMSKGMWRSNFGRYCSRSSGMGRLFFGKHEFTNGALGGYVR